MRFNTAADSPGGPRAADSPAVRSPAGVHNPAEVHSQAGAHNPAVHGRADRSLAAPDAADRNPEASLPGRRRPRRRDPAPGRSAGSRRCRSARRRSGSAGRIRSGGSGAAAVAAALPLRDCRRSGWRERHFVRRKEELTRPAQAARLPAHRPAEQPRWKGSSATAPRPPRQPTAPRRSRHHSVDASCLNLRIGEDAPPRVRPRYSDRTFRSAFRGPSEQRWSRARDPCGVLTPLATPRRRKMSRRNRERHRRSAGAGAGRDRRGTGRG